MGPVFVTKIQIEYSKGHNLRGAVVHFSDGTVWKLLPEDEKFKDMIIGKLRAKALADDMLKNRGQSGYFNK